MKNNNYNNNTNKNKTNNDKKKDNTANKDNINKKFKKGVFDFKTFKEEYEKSKKLGIIANDNSIKNEINNNQEESDNSVYEDCEDKIEPVPDFDSFASLQKKFTIKTMPGDGNCLFNSLSYLIFETSDYNGIIRQKICDYMSRTNYNDDDADYKKCEEKIVEMRRDGEYGSGIEVKAFCELCNIRITIYIRTISGKMKQKTDKIEKMVSGEDNNENFAILLDDYGPIYELKNHFDVLYPKEGFNINKNKLLEIKKMLCDIKEDCNNIDEEIKKKAKKTISGKTGKKTGSRKGNSIWNIYYPLTRRKQKKDSYSKYNIDKKNDVLKEKVIYSKVTKCLLLSEIIDLFNKNDIIKNGIKNIVENYKDILIDKINNKKITNNEIVKLMNINDDRAKEIHNCICYECSGMNGNGKETFKIYNSLYELKSHCNSLHNGSFDNCVINYNLKRSYVEIQIQSNGNFYMLKIDDLLKEDKEDYLRNIKAGYKNEIRIIGENIRSLNETNRALLSNILDTERPDFMLLNECNIGKAKFNMSGYKLELSDNNEVGILYRDIYYLNDVYKNIEDNYNMIKMINTTKGKLILYCAYLPPGEGHNMRIKELIDKLLLLKRRYKSLSLILFGDLNIDRKNIKEKLCNKIVQYGFKVIYDPDENIYTHEQKINNKISKSYLDYIITYGIEFGNFEVRDKLVNTDHNAIEYDFFEDETRKLCRIKETIEPYIRVSKKSEEIKDKLIEVFKSDIPEVKLLRLIHDNKYTYKAIKRKFNFRTNMIKNIVNNIKELQKKGDFYTISKIIHKHRTENWELFLKELYDLRIKNNVKEYFLRLRFYTVINKNTVILKNLKIQKDDLEIITLDKEEINNAVIAKYKDLLGDKGFKEIYSNINDKTITIDDNDINYAHKNVIKNKAVSWDLIPGISLKNAIKPEYYNKIKNILNRYLIPGVIPEEITTSRLFCLNKKANEPGDINNIRPIAISSTILKMIESSILTRLLNEINEKKLINKKQIGFIKGCGTELNLLRLRQRVYDIKKVKNCFPKYLLFIDLKNAYDKVDHKRLFNKLTILGISKEIIGTIKLLYSRAKLKISNNNECINVNNGVLQGSLISPMLFDLYINDLINELDLNAFDVLAYADDLCVLCEGRSQLINVINIIDKWSTLNKIKVNKLKSGIMILKYNDNTNENNIEEYPIINEYKYLGILINDKMNIQKHIGNIDKKLDEYFQRNYILNKKYFSVKSILLIFGYFHKSRLLYGLPAFIDQKSKINRVDNLMIFNIKRLLKLANRTNNERLKIALGLPDLFTFLVQRLIKLKVKYEYVFEEKLTLYDKSIKEILDIDDISAVRTGYNYLYNKLKLLGNKEGLDINQGFINRLKHRIYSWYVNSDFILLKFMCHRGSFRDDIYKKCILCKDADNGLIHVVNECAKLANERKQLLKDLNSINKRKDTELLKAIEFHYYSKSYTNKKAENKDDNKGIKLIKEFIETLYKEMTEERIKRK